MPRQARLARRPRPWICLRPSLVRATNTRSYSAGKTSKFACARRASAPTRMGRYCTLLLAPRGHVVRLNFISFGRLGTNFDTETTRIDAQAEALRRANDEPELHVHECKAEFVETTRIGGRIG